MRSLWVLSLSMVLILGSALCGCASVPLSSPRSVTIIADGRERTVETLASTVREVLVEQGIVVGPLDRVQPPETASLSSGATVLVTRVSEHTETYTRTVPFARQVVRDATVPEGESRLLQLGKEGLLTQVFRITEEDLVEVERVLIEELLTTPPQDEIRLIGTRPSLQPVDIWGVLVYLNSQDAWLLRGSTRERQRLTTYGDLDGRVLSLSARGDRLLFTRTVTAADKLNELWVVSTVETSAQPVPISADNVLWADWAPDSDTIAWSTAEVIDRPPGWRGQNDLWIAALNPRSTLTNRRRLVEPEAGGGYGWWGTRYAWSPSGRWLAFSRPESIGVVNQRDGSSTLLAKFPGYRTFSSWAWNPPLSWSSDERFLVTVIHGLAPDPTADPELSPVFDLVAIETGGSYSLTLLSETGMWASPRFSGDGQTIVFGRAVIPYQSDSSAYRLCLIDRDGSDQRCVYPDTGSEGIELPKWIWTPDDAQIAFILRGDIFVFDIAQSGIVPLTDQGATSQMDWCCAPQPEEPRSAR